MERSRKDTELIFHIDIEDRVHDKRTWKDIWAKLEAVADTPSFLPEVMELDDNKLFMVFKDRTDFKKRILAEPTLSERLYAHLVKLPTKTLSHVFQVNMDDEEFFDFARASDESWGRILGDKLLRQKLWELMAQAPEDLIAAEVAYLNVEQFMDFAAYSDESFEKVLGHPEMSERYFSIVEDMSVDRASEEVDYLTDDQLLALVRYSDENGGDLRDNPEIARRLAAL